MWRLPNFGVSSFLGRITIATVGLFRFHSGMYAFYACSEVPLLIVVMPCPVMAFCRCMLSVTVIVISNFILMMSTRNLHQY